MHAALDAESAATIGPAAPCPLVIALPGDTKGGVAGGLWGCTMFAWLHIQILVVPPAARGQGLGRALLARAEAEARARGCIAALVDRFSFQADGFYEKCGYGIFAVLDNYPPGHRRLYLRKSLI